MDIKASTIDIWEASYKEVVTLPYRRTWLKLVTDAAKCNGTRVYMLDGNTGYVNLNLGFFALKNDTSQTITFYIHKLNSVSDPVMHMLGLITKVRKRLNVKRRNMG